MKKEICFNIHRVVRDDMCGYYEESEIRKNIVVTTNYLYDECNVIKFFIARGSKTKIRWRESLEKMFEDGGIPYHSFVFGKPRYDLAIDYKTNNFDDFQNPYVGMGD